MADVPNFWFEAAPEERPVPVTVPEPPAEYLSHPSWNDFVKTFQTAIMAWNTRPDVIERCHMGRLSCNPMPYVPVKGMALVNQWTCEKFSWAFLQRFYDLPALNEVEPITTELLSAAYAYALLV